VYTLITVIVQGILGPKETAHLLSPTILAYRSVEIPDTFIERVDGYFHIFWIPVFVVCMLDWYHFAAFGIKRMLKLEDSRPVVALLLPIIQYFIDVPPDFQTAGKIAKMANFAFGIWGLGVLPLLLLIAWLKEKRRNAC
jgi:spore germination protein